MTDILLHISAASPARHFFDAALPPHDGEIDSVLTRTGARNLLEHSGFLYPLKSAVAALGWARAATHAKRHFTAKLASQRRFANGDWLPQAIICRVGT